MNVIWLSSAAEHLEDLYNFLAKDDPKAAAHIYNTIIEEADKLSAFPQMASLESSLEEEVLSYRSLVVNRTYKVIYRIEPEAEKIIIVSVWDCRQNPEMLKGKTLRK